MASLDRVLLYLVSLTLAAILVLDGRGSSARGQTGSSAEAGFEARDKSATLPPSEERATSQTPVPSTPRAEPVGAGLAEPGLAEKGPLKSLRIVDSEGRARIELLADDSLGPSIVLRNRAGEEALKINCNESGDTGLTIVDSRGGAKLSIGAQGEKSLTLQGKDGVATTLKLDQEGSAELRMTGGAKAPDVVVRRSQAGPAEIALGPQSGKSGVLLRLTDAGAASLALLGPDGTTGPVLQVFEDGLAEVAIHGASSGSGPSLIRMPDGVTILSARLPNGEPGASMLVSPDGEAVIAVNSGDGVSRAEMRVTRDGQPSIGSIGGDAGAAPRQSPAPQAAPPAKPDDRRSKPAPRPARSTSPRVTLRD
jgi:hypothetical protein